MPEGYPISVGAKDMLSVVGDAYRMITSGKQTEGAYTVIDMLVPPGDGPGPHAHKDINELFYVVDGEIEFKTEAGKYQAKKVHLSISLKAERFIVSKM